MELHLTILQLLKNMHVVLNQVKFLNLTVQLYNLMVYSVVVHVVGLLSDMFASLYYSSLVTFGTVHAQSSVTYLLVLTKTLMNKQNSVNTKNLVTLALFVKLSNFFLPKEKNRTLNHVSFLLRYLSFGAKLFSSSEEFGCSKALAISF